MEKDVSVSDYRSKAKTFSCTFCEKAYKLRYELKNHMRSHTGERPAVCHFCKKGFFDTKSLNKHLKIHTQENLFECEFCGRKFNYQTSLIIHRRLHTGEKPYKCEVCEKRFSQPAALKAHKKIHRDDGKFRCKFCASSFDLVGRLKSHVTLFHKDFNKIKAEPTESQEKVVTKSLTISGMFVDCDADEDDISDDADEFNSQNGWTIHSPIKREKEDLIYEDDLSDHTHDQTTAFIKIKQEFVT